jgi:hypothetical protein
MLKGNPTGTQTPPFHRSTDHQQKELNIGYLKDNITEIFAYLNIYSTYEANDEGCTGKKNWASTTLRSELL